MSTKTPFGRHLATRAEERSKGKTTPRTTRDVPRTMRDVPRTTRDARDVTGLIKGLMKLCGNDSHDDAITSSPVLGQIEDLSFRERSEELSPRNMVSGFLFQIFYD
jgi:hypothetical protein